MIRQHRQILVEHGDGNRRPENAQLPTVALSVALFEIEPAVHDVAGLGEFGAWRKSARRPGFLCERRVLGERDAHGAGPLAGLLADTVLETPLRIALEEPLGIGRVEGELEIGDLLFWSVQVTLRR